MSVTLDIYDEEVCILLPSLLHDGPRCGGNLLASMDIFPVGMTMVPVPVFPPPLS